MSRIVLLGGGGFAKEVLELAQLNDHECVAYVGECEGVVNLPFWGKPEELLKRRKEFDHVVLGFGAVDRRSVEQRALMIGWLNENAFTTLALVSPHAVISSGVEVGKGSIVAHGVIMSVDSSLGDYCIVNSSAIIGHDTKIDENVIIAPAAFLGGNVNVGNSTLIGPGSMTLEGRSIGDRVIVSIGASVVRNVKSDSTVVPNRSLVR